MADTERQGESAPLLRDVGTNTSDTSDTPDTDNAAESALPLRRMLRIAVPFFLFITMVEVAASLCSFGLAALVERSLCRTKFPDVADPYSDPRCKEEGIQADLAWMIGMESTVSIIPGLLMAIPYGTVADKYGPHIPLGLMSIGQLFSEGGHLLVCLNPQIFDVRWIYASSFMTIIGGGGATYGAMRYVIAASLVSAKNRTTVFLYMSAYDTVMAFLIGPLGYFLMSRLGPVWTQSIGVGMIAMMIVLGFAMPHNTPPSVAKSEAEQVSIIARVTGVVKSTALALRHVFGRNLQLTFLLGGMAFTTLGAYERTFRLQYATKRFGWTWAQASLLSSVVATSNFTMLVVVLPAISYFMLKRNFSALSKDLWLARGSGFIQVLGSFLTALAPTGPVFVGAIALYECNRGFGPAMVSLIVSVAERAGIDQHSTIYASVSTVLSVGAIMAGPVMASAFKVGMKWGQSWYGLPFLAAGMLQLLTFLILVFVRQK